MCRELAVFWNKKQLLHRVLMASLSHFPSPAAVRAKQSRKEREQQYLPRRQGPNKGALEEALVPLHIYGDTAHVHVPYKSVTGRHTYVIYLMFFNIHAYLGFIQFIKFSVWPAEKRKIEADVRRLPPFKRSPTFLLGNASAATAMGLPCPGLALPPSFPPSLPPQGGLSSQVLGSLQPPCIQEHKSQARKACCRIGSLQQANR